MKTKTLAELADLCGAELIGDPAREVEGPASLVDAGAREVSFFAHGRHKDEFLATRAAAVLVPKGFESPRNDLSLLFCADPSSSFSHVGRAFVPAEDPPAAGVHVSAVVDPSARVAADASIGAHCTAGPKASIGAGAVLHPGVHLARDVEIGAGTVLHPGVVCYAGVRIGARCIVHAGAVIGADGYGFEPSKDPNVVWTKIPQCGTVVVEDDVEIGANATIDRGRFGATRIGRNAKIDNLVHIAHNVIIGEGALIIAQVGIAGSSKVGPRAILAGKVGVNGHVEIGAGARIAAQAGVFNDVPAGADYLGWPARPRVEALRHYALVQRLPEMQDRLKRMEKELATLHEIVKGKET